MGFLFRVPAYHSFGRCLFLGKLLCLRRRHDDRCKHGRGRKRSFERTYQYRENERRKFLFNAGAVMGQFAKGEEAGIPAKTLSIRERKGMQAGQPDQ